MHSLVSATIRHLHDLTIEFRQLRILDLLDARARGVRSQNFLVRLSRFHTMSMESLEAALVQCCLGRGAGERPFFDEALTFLKHFGSGGSDRGRRDRRWLGYRCQSGFQSKDRHTANEE